MKVNLEFTIIFYLTNILTNINQYCFDCKNLFISILGKQHDLLFSHLYLKIQTFHPLLHILYLEIDLQSIVKLYIINFEIRFFVFYLMLFYPKSCTINNHGL
jgi:hypothetical protein